MRQAPPKITPPDPGLFTFNDETIARYAANSRWRGGVPRGVDADKVRYTGVVKRYETFAEMARLLARTDQIRADVEEGKSCSASTVTTIDAG